MDQYKISIIVPVYNVEKYVERAMQSLLEQTIGFENLQIIFVDDCSIDGSWKIVMEYDRKYDNVLAFRLSKNSGSAGTPRNKGLEYVKSKYVMFLDPDDEYEIDACEILYNEMENNGVDFVSGLHIEIDETGKKFENRTKQYKEIKEGIYDLSNGLQFAIEFRGVFWEKIYKNEIIREKAIRFADNIPGEDTFFLCNYILHSTKAKYINHCVYKYLLRSTSISFSKTRIFFDGINECYKMCYKIFQECGKSFYFKFLIKWVIDDYFNLLFDCEFIESDIIEILRKYSWLCIYYRENKIEIRSEYNFILASILLQEDYNLLFDAYMKLKTIKKYVLELESTKKYFLNQIENKDTMIDNLSKSNLELKKWTDELEKSKCWFLEQIKYKDKHIKDLKNDLKDAKSKCEKMLLIKNYYEQPFYKRLFIEKPKFKEKK